MVAVGVVQVCAGHVCAPLGAALDGTQLPSNEYGSWVINGATAAAWPSILANVTEFRLSAFDYQTNQNEAAGYDYACVSVPAPAVAAPAAPTWELWLLGGLLLLPGATSRSGWPANQR